MRERNVLVLAGGRGEREAHGARGRVAQEADRVQELARGAGGDQDAAAAKAAFANSPDAMDERFDRDHAAWVISEQVRLAAEAAAAAAAAQGGGG